MLATFWDWAGTALFRAYVVVAPLTEKTSAAKDCNWMRSILYILYVFEIFDLLWFFVLFCWSRSHCIPWTLEFYPDSSWFFRFLRLQRGMNQLMVGAILHPLELHSTTLDPGISTLCICRCKPRFVSSITSTKQHKNDIIIYIYKYVRFNLSVNSCYHWYICRIHRWHCCICFMHLHPDNWIWKKRPSRLRLMDFIWGMFFQN